MQDAVTVGVDLAASPASTAVVRIVWSGGGRVVDVRTPADDDVILEVCDGAAKIGIDCPFGWPDAFVDFVTAHRTGPVTTPADSVAARGLLAYRETDRYVQRHFGLRPLSVSADRIGHAAMRCAGLLARLGADDRSGAGLIAETYPAGSLRQWGLQHRRYKDDPAAITRSLTTIEDATGLRFDTGRDACLASDHAFDAVVCALTARALQVGLADPVPASHTAVARREGWIRLPSGLLADLVPSS